MREIKFRAWNGKFMEIRNFNLEWNKKNETHFHKGATLMQFTGLKDKNGKEIYEGDIVITDNLLKYYVFFMNGFYCLKSVKTNLVIHKIWEMDNLEVIGNIYENPELLNSAQEKEK